MTALVGFQKLAALNPRLLGAAAGAGLGFAAAPPDEGATAALVGAGMGYGAGALGSRLAGKLRPAVAATPHTAPAGGNAGVDAMAAEINAMRMREWDAALEAHKARAAAAAPATVAAAPAPVAASTAAHAAPAPVAAPAAPAPAAAAAPAAPVVTKWRTPRRTKKQADFNLSAPLPGGFGYGVSRKDERIPGMTRWVPRHVLEDAFAGVDAGYDDAALIEAARREAPNHSLLLAGTLGGGLAGAALHPSIAGIGAGALAGHLLARHQRKRFADRAASNMENALRGVHHERRSTHESAREAIPAVLGTPADG